MAEESEAETPIQRAKRALDKAGARYACPSCGNLTWRNDPEPVGLGVIHDGVARPEEGIPALALICERCGFIRMHAIKSLDDLLEEAS